MFDFFILTIDSGKIVNLSVTPTSSDAEATKSATVTFEKESAAKTALLLDNTQLGAAQVHVKSAASLAELADTHKESEAAAEHDGISQDDKPRSRIIAEYLAHGYVLSDKIIEQALALDKQHGVSSRFTKALTDFDTKYNATDKAKAADDKFGVSRSATQAWNSFNSYFDSAINTPSGQKLRQFYDVGNKQVLDVHNEARHLANLKSGKPAVASSYSAPVEEKAPIVDEKTGA
jgi:hypothetical protein